MAYVFDSPGGSAQLDVLVGDTLLQFGLDGPASGREESIVRLARQAVERLVAGEGIRAEMAPNRKLLGEWTASHGKSRLYLVVRPDQSLALSVSTTLSGVLSTEADRWQLLDRARRPVDAGGFAWQGENELLTTGGIEARWRRLQRGRSPGRIPQSLISGTGVEEGTPTPAGPWPREPPCPAAVGRGRLQFPCQGGA